ncbi:hypothetical protein ACVIKO_000738 [Rhizobium ruizarguesonis]
MPLHFEQPVINKTEQSRAHIGITDADVVQMLAAYRLFGFWRIDIETGHFFASEDVQRSSTSPTATALST